MGVPITRFNWVDVVAVILFIRMGYVGYRLGLGSELIKLAGAVVGFFVSFYWYQPLGSFLSNWTFLSKEWAAAIVMIVLVVVGYLLVTRGLRLMEKLIQVSFQAKVSNVGGLIAGLVRAGFVTSVFLVVCQHLPSDYLSASIEERSFTGSRMARVAPAVYGVTKPWVGYFWTGLHAPLP